MADVQHKDLPESQLHDVKGATTSTEGQILKSTGGASAWAAAVNQGFMDYNDTLTAAVPITIAANTWTTVTNNGAGAFTNKTYKPFGITELMNSNGQFDFSELPLGTTVLIRNDFTVVPSINDSLLSLRYQLGGGGGEYTLETIISRLDSGSGLPYREGLRTDLIYMGDTNTRDNPVTLQIKLSSPGTVVNAGSVIQVLGR
jgi:hypothetical protein